MSEQAMSSGPATLESNTSALELRGVKKRYGQKEALVGLDLSVPRGSIFGLVGPNGAGKTTTFSILCGYVTPDEGVVDILGKGTFDPALHRGKVTALPQDSALGRDMPVAEQLVFFAQLQGRTAAEARGDVERLLTVVDLADRARDRVRMLSHGMMRRMGIAQAFLGVPELVLLDEPTNGLDPRQAGQVRDFIASQRGTRTIIVSSHNLNEIEALCDHVALIDRGRVVMAGPVGQVTGRQADIRIGLSLGPVPLEALRVGLAEDEIRWEEAPRTLNIRFKAREGREAEDVIAEALSILLQHGARIGSVQRGQSLERTFLEST
ncbi:MAG: ABC transporter ATP-binding protein [Myxococcota bacterium]